ncbi:MAG: ABC transporter permease subunit [Lachnospiraceae bacterium]|nr:ABC transporter permease subunit [Lachnospiraceae bacterium]
MKTKGAKLILLIMIFTLSLSLLAGVVSRAEGAGTSSANATSTGRRVSDYNGKRVGVLAGTMNDTFVIKALPDAKLSYYNNISDMIAALEADKVDCIAGDEPVLSMAASENDRLELLDESLQDYDLGAIFPKTQKGEKLLSEFNEFLTKLKASGELDEIYVKWKTGPEEKKTLPDYSNFPAPNGMLTMATEGSYPPLDYFRGTEIVGAEVDLAARFCEAYGYGLKIEAMNFDGVLASAQTGKADFGLACITISEERKQSLNFSVPYYKASSLLMVLKDGASGGSSALKPEFTKFSELSGKTVSMLTGAPFEELVKEKAPGVSNFTFFNSMPDMTQALKTKKTDAILMNNAVNQLALNRNSDLALFPQSLKDSAFGIAFAKGDKRRDEWQKAFDSIPKDEIEVAWKKWTGADDSIKDLPQQDWPGAKGTVSVAVCDTLEPMSYIGKDNELRGFDLEIILMVAKKLDYKVEFTGMEFSAVLAAVQSGKADMGGGSIIISPERAEAVDFLEYYPASFQLVVRAVNSQNLTGNSFFDSIRESFIKTFIREDRWKLFVEGIITTLVITLLSMLFGTLLGFWVFLLCRNGNPVANIITKICLWIVRGMPAVVLLMVLYFIVFGSVQISGIAVAVIGFTLTFGAAVIGLLKMGVGAIDNGQYEAAYALGYSNRKTFFKIILPQALRHVLPSYKGEVVSLIKATAIVGYIAVQDLTKMGDIVRSRTYEAFFPLIAVTIIYFVLEWLVGLIISRISVDINPKRRRPEKILKGIKETGDGSLSPLSQLKGVNTNDQN